MLRACQELGDSVLIRLKSNRKLSPPVRRFTRGRPPHDGPLLQGTRPDTPCDPSATWQTTDQEGSMTRVCRFEEVHVQQDRTLIFSVIRVERRSARGTTRDPRVRWFLTLDEVVPVEQVPQRDGLRFSEEHLFRFLKQDVLWLAAHVRTPEPCVHWSWIVALAFMQVSLACPLVLQALLWEAKGRPVTPQQICQVMPTMVSQVGTPLPQCRPRGNAPGRAKGFRLQRAPRHPVIHTTSTKEKKGKATASLCVLLTFALHVNSSFLVLTLQRCGSVSFGLSKYQSCREPTFVVPDSFGVCSEGAEPVVGSGVSHRA